MFLLSQKTDEEIFRAIAIHYGKIINNSDEINMDLVQNLNQIYETCTSYSLFFSKDIANKILNINNKKENVVNMASMNPKSILDTEDYTVSIEDLEKYS